MFPPLRVIPPGIFLRVLGGKILMEWEICAGRKHMVRSVAGFLLMTYCILIFVLSGQSKLPMPMLFSAQDKIIHAVAYALMGLLAWITFTREQRPLIVVFTVSVLFCSLYGLSDEWHQSFVPGRDASFGDWLADTLGATITATVLLKLSRPHAAIQRGVNQR